MKTIEIKNVKEVKMDNGTLTVTYEEETINVVYVPECIGFFDENTLIFNGGKSFIYANNGLYNIYTFNNEIKNINNGKNLTFKETTFDKLNVKDVFVFDLDYIDNLEYYHIKIKEDRVVYIGDDEDILCVNQNKTSKVFKVIKV